jgi:hypothetical protein
MKTTKYELFSAGVTRDGLWENVPDDQIEYVGEYDSLEEAAADASRNGVGWFFWSQAGRGCYLGSIHVDAGKKTDAVEF